MELFGYLAAILMGLILGSIGGGGSILTVPILVYIMGVPPTTATGYSLLIVGSSAAYGAYRYHTKGLVKFKQSILFAIPSLIAVYSARAFIIPSLPDILFETPVTISKDFFIMVLFASLMFLSAFMMLRNSYRTIAPTTNERHIAIAPLAGICVGMTTGILGAGGGFLIIPSLVLLMGIPMKEAIGSSLCIIAINSLLGFLGDLQSGIELQIPLLPIMITATIGGMWAATSISHRFDSRKLQRLFAYFTLIVACIILFEELFNHGA